MLSWCTLIGVWVVFFPPRKRRGAINQKQLQFLESYKPMNKGKVCSIM